MGINYEMAERAEARAKEVARQAGKDSLWELFLHIAYQEIVEEARKPQICAACHKQLPSGHPGGVCLARDEPDYF